MDRTRPLATRFAVKEMEAFRGSLPKVKWPELNLEESPNPKFILCMFITGLFHIGGGGSSPTRCADKGLERLDLETSPLM